MRLILALFFLSWTSADVLACRTNSDCRQPGTRCITANVPLAIPWCGPWGVKDAVPPKTVVLGQGNPRPARSLNRAATGESCNTDRDCPTGKMCTRPDANAAWRCVTR